jgi:tRNA (cmo5U34)-methyltransferase
MTIDQRSHSDDLLTHFNDATAVARYAEGPRRFVPGVEAVHRMAGILIAERVGADASVLVLGAGGGLELKAFADAYPDWTFDGVDPAREMLALARRTLGAHAPRARLHEGLIDVAPDGPFDAGVCLLTLHFLAPDERLRTLAQVHRRLAPGAPFVAMHASFPQEADARTVWLSRYAAYALASGADPEQVRNAHAAVTAHLQTLSPAHDEALLRAAGFSDVEVFYTAFTFRGWIAYA